MNNINFFEPYLNKTNKNRSYGKYIPLVLASILVIGLVFYQSTLSKEKSELTNEISSIEAEMNDPQMQADYKDALEAQEAMEVAKAVLDESEKIANEIKNGFTVTRDLIQNVVNSVPENTYIISMNYNNSSVKIDCISDSYDSAAQFIHNIKSDNGLVADVFMPYVNEENGDYKYSLNVEIGGELNETKQ